MDAAVEVDLDASPTPHFVEHVPDLVYDPFRGGQAVRGGGPLHLDLLKPVSAAPTPLVVFVKGGGFRTAHRMRYLPALVGLARRGVAVASVEYRTSNEARFPAPVDDVRRAIRWLREHADRLDVDPRAVAVWGNSAGGTVAGIVGATATGVADRVCAVASWYGVHDPGRVEAFQDPDSPIRAALGPGPRDGGRWFAPSDHVHAGSAPTFLLHGTHDEVVDVGQSKLLAAELSRHGVEHELVLVRGGGHSFAQMCTRTDALARTGDFLCRHLRAATRDC